MATSSMTSWGEFMGFVKRHLAWDTIGADEVETVRRHAGALVAALAAEGGRS